LTAIDAHAYRETLIRHSRHAITTMCPVRVQGMSQARAEARPVATMRALLCDLCVAILDNTFKETAETEHMRYAEEGIPSGA
jgi:hypothetical protein